MTEHRPRCPKSGCAACFEHGQRDAIAAAVQRVETLVLENLLSEWFINAIIATIKGDKP